MSSLPVPQDIEGLDSETLEFHRISKKPNGEFYCALCWKNPTDGWQVLTHLQSHEHQRRMKNEQYEADPLAFVPHPHRDFTQLVDGWATCTICDERMDEKHCHSVKHMRWVNHLLQQRTAFGSIGSVPLHAPDTSPPLPQPPPPPGRSSSVSGSGGAHTPHVSCGDVVSAVSVAPGMCGFDMSRLAPLPSHLPLPVLRHDAEYPWGSRSFKGEVRNDDEWS